MGFLFDHLSNLKLFYVFFFMFASLILFSLFCYHVSDSSSLQHIQSCFTQMELSKRRILKPESLVQCIGAHDDVSELLTSLMQNLVTEESKVCHKRDLTSSIILILCAFFYQN